MENRR